MRRLVMVGTVALFYIGGVAHAVERDCDAEKAECEKEKTQGKQSVAGREGERSKPVCKQIVETCWSREEGGQAGHECKEDKTTGKATCDPSMYTIAVRWGCRIKKACIPRASLPKVATTSDGRPLDFFERVEKETEAERKAIADTIHRLIRERTLTQISEVVKPVQAEVEDLRKRVETIQLDILDLKRQNVAGNDPKTQEQKPVDTDLLLRDIVDLQVAATLLQDHLKIPLGQRPQKQRRKR